MAISFVSLDGTAPAREDITSKNLLWGFKDFRLINRETQCECGLKMFLLVFTEQQDISHPSVEEDLCLENEVRDKTIWKSTPEL